MEPGPKNGTLMTQIKRIHADKKEGTAKDAKKGEKGTANER